MSKDLMLHEKLTQGKDFLGGADCYIKLVPEFIAPNLNPTFSIRPYQKEVFGRFEYYLDTFASKPKGVPLNLLYHMATGSGKTLVMAGEILSLYKRGYRNFLFFVNSTNIIKKTKENFLNKSSSKYLFNDVIQINTKQIRIREVDNFAAANPDDINIIFTTIQGLHVAMNMAKENSITYDDFQNYKTVLISDEAHHINAETKKGKKSDGELLSISTWENTVKSILLSNPENLLLEFTATADLTDENVADKYKDNILFDYPLKAFRIDGYSKEVQVFQSDNLPFQRALQALVLSQFRRKVFEKNKLIIKPVVLFKSKTIKDSLAFHSEFTESIKSLTGKDLSGIKEKATDALKDAFDYFATNNISLDNLALELQEDFSIDKTIEVNSETDSIVKQVALNSLEDADNEYRAIFAVDKLNEGWDVLNLFDIVRMYNTRDAKSGKPGKTTVKEAQLIGRGARYCPFKINDEQPLYQRKYDICEGKELHELKICEELYYHAEYNPRYIDELHRALEEIGIKAKETRTLNLKIKESFKETHFFEHGFIYKNEKIKYLREDVFGIDTSLIETTYHHNLVTGSSSSILVFEEIKNQVLKKKTKTYKILDFGKHVVRKALSKLPEFKFNELKHLFPNLATIDEFISSKYYLGALKVDISGNEADVDCLSQECKLNATLSVLRTIGERMHQDKVDYKGTTKFKEHQVRTVFTDKVLNIANDGKGDKEFGIGQAETRNPSLTLDLDDKEWFAFNDNFGTSEEKYLVRYIDQIVDDLQKEYEEVYLLRNEKHFQLYNFDDGKAFEPDFVLFLTKKEAEGSIIYQVFIEPKGEHLLEKDEWKQSFLKRLKSEHKIEQVWQGKEFIIWGMPFYNEKITKHKFVEEIDNNFLS